MESDLTYFAAPSFFQKEIISQNEVHAWFKGSAKDADLKNLEFYFCTPDLETPEVLVAQSEKYPNQSALMFSLAPSFVKRNEADPQDLVLGEEAMKPKPKEYLDQEGGSYIFLVDRSGSMCSGQRVPLTREAMILFMKSLPVGSKF